MIKVLELEINEFRGIPHLSLTMEGKSFAISGPNGSGKSGVIDAIDFALNGTIARLSGSGMAGVSIQNHGPHVRSRHEPGEAWVKLKFHDTASGESGTVLRTVEHPNRVNLDPDTPALRTALEKMRQHPEITLSRRHIVNFILTEPAKRAEKVHALLQLNSLGEQRRALRSAVTKLKQERTNAEVAQTNARSALLRHLGIREFTNAKILGLINEKRRTVGLPEIDILKWETDFKDGVETTGVSFDKSSALRDIHALIALRENTDQLDTAMSRLATEIAGIGNDSAMLDALNHRGFVSTGLSLVQENALCPLCDTQWDSTDQLRQHLEQKINLAEEAERQGRAVKEAGANVLKIIKEERSTVVLVQQLAIVWATPKWQATLQEWHDALVLVESFLSDLASILAKREMIEARLLVRPPSDLDETLKALSLRLEAQPDASAKVAAQNFLTVAAERWEQVHLASQTSEIAKETHSLSEKVYNTYCDVVDSSLMELYSEVEHRFSHFYQRINSDDESTFRAELIPSAGSLDLAVDFYSFGMFPPGAYHSEGHQDSMGICLYLALVEKILGSGFTMSVLDDVVMSVDSNHRREFIELLRVEFPNVQFIITTHDEVWAKQMQSSRLIDRRAQIRFRGWSVNAGPVYERGKIFWDRIDEDLEHNDVPGAAHKLRRGLEAELREVAEALRARVVYRGDTNYELGELLDAIKGRYNDWLKKAAHSANSWNNRSEVERVAQLQADRSNAESAQSEENWAINALVHYNEWASFTKSDFTPVVDAWREFLGLFLCGNPDCDTWIHVTGTPGHEDTLRCRCGQYSLNLLSKGR